MLTNFVQMAWNHQPDMLLFRNMFLGFSLHGGVKKPQVLETQIAFRDSKCCDNMCEKKGNMWKKSGYNQLRLVVYPITPPKFSIAPEKLPFQ